MATVYKKRDPMRHPAVVWSRFKWRWPFMAWMIAVVITIYLVSISGSFQFMTGVVNAESRVVAPLEDAVLAEVSASSGQLVDAGDVLAVLDTALLDASLEVERLQVERQFSGEILDLERELRDLRMRMTEDEAELEVLDTEIARLEPLQRQGLLDGMTLVQMKARRLAIQRRAALYPDTVTKLEEDLAHARKLRRDVARWMSGPDAQPLPTGVATNLPAGTQAELALRQETMGLLQLRRQAYTLRAMRAATVSRVRRAPGEIVRAGEEIMTIVYHGDHTITGYLPESNMNELQVGQLVYITRSAKLSAPIYAHVRDLGPEVMGLPGRVSPVPGQTLRGRRVVLEPDGDADLLPGETVGIHLRPPLWRELARKLGLGDGT